MLNALCRCFYFWQTNDDDENLDNNQSTSFQRSEICLDVTRSGKKDNRIEIIK